MRRSTSECRDFFFKWLRRTAFLYSIGGSCGYVLLVIKLAFDRLMMCIVYMQVRSLSQGLQRSVLCQAILCEVLPLVVFQPKFFQHNILTSPTHRIKCLVNLSLLWLRRAKQTISVIRTRSVMIKTWSGIAKGLRLQF